MIFELGQCVATRNAVELMKAQGLNPLLFLARHMQGDDGDLSPADKAMNKAAIESGQDRVFSSYKLPSGDKLWVITEWDRSYTTILLPDDY